MQKFRDWCENYSPIFDFFSKMVLGLSSAVIAIFAVIISGGQFEIQKNQIEIQRQQAQAQMQQHLPSIVVRYSPRKNSNPRLDDLIISNEGADLFDPEFEVIVFWNPRELEIIRPSSDAYKSSPSKLLSAEIPVINFFPNVSWGSSETKGELYRISGTDQRKWETITREFCREQYTLNTSMVSNPPRIYVRAKYLDKFRKPHTEYFEVSSLGQSLLDATEGAYLFQKYQDAIKSEKILNHYSLTLADVRKYWDEYKH